MSYDIEMAKMFKERENPNIDEPVIGTILSIDPIEVSLYKGQVILQANQCYICETLKNIKGDIKLDNTPTNGSIVTSFTITRGLEIGDNVMCVPTSKGQKYFIVDRVV